MKIKKNLTISSLLFVISLASFVSGCSQKPEQPVHPLDTFFETSVKAGEVRFVRLSDASSAILMSIADKNVLIDPAMLRPDEIEVLARHGVDLVLYTHVHTDHFELNTAIELVKTLNPVFVIDADILSQLENVVAKDRLIVAQSGQAYNINGIVVDAFKGEHLCPITLFRLKIAGITVFHGADSAAVPLTSMQADLAFVPTGGASPTCSPEDAFKMVLGVKPKVVVPFHGKAFEDKKLQELVAKDMATVKVIVSAYYEVQNVVIP